MGIFWLSHAEVVTTEPQKLKELIEQIAQEEPSTETDSGVAPIHDLNVEKNSVLFNSAGYGCYGVEWENPGPLLSLETL